MNPNQTLRGNPELRKVVLAAFLGTVIEWYDFFLYGTAAALVFNQLFFPTFSPAAGTIAAFATYAVGFLARPLGGVFFGYIGDRCGRKVALVWTLSLMGLATFLVGCLPTYHAVGPLAPTLLVLVRFVQGFAVGGEWGGAVLLSVESGHRGRRGFLGSWTQAGVAMGSLISTVAFRLAHTLPEPQFLSWGWRGPFLVGIVLTILGFIVRRTIQESPLFQAFHEPPAPGLAPAAPATTPPAPANPASATLDQATPKTENPLLAVIRADWRSLLIVLGARLAENASYYVFTVFALSYARQLLVPEYAILNALVLASALEFLAILAFGLLSDRLGRRPVYVFGTLALVILAYPFFWLIQTRDVAAISTALTLALCLAHAAMYAPQAAFFSELFGTRVRFSGVSLGYQFSGIFAGGFAPMISAALLAWAGGSPWAVAVYLMTLGLISTMAVLLARETHHSDIAR